MRAPAATAAAHGLRIVQACAGPGMCPARQVMRIGASAAEHVGALQRVAVSGGLVAAAVGDAWDGLDAEVVVPERAVAREGCRHAVDVDAVVAGTGRRVAQDQRVGGRRRDSVYVGADGDTVDARVADEVAAHRGPDGRIVGVERIDRDVVAERAEYPVVCQQVALAAPELDAVAAAELAWLLPRAADGVGDLVGGDAVAVTEDADVVGVAVHPVVADLVVVALDAYPAALAALPDVRVAGHRVVRDQVVVGAANDDAVTVSGHGVPLDPDVVREAAEHDPGAVVGGGVAFDLAVRDPAADEDAAEQVAGGRDTTHAVVACAAEDLDPIREFPDLAALDRHPVVTTRVLDSNIAIRSREPGTVRHPLAVAVNRVTVQVDRDVVGPDHEPVAPAVGEVVGELDAVRERLPAIDGDGRRGLRRRGKE